VQHLKLACSSAIVLKGTTQRNLQKYSWLLYYSWCPFRSVELDFTVSAESWTALFSMPLHVIHMLKHYFCFPLSYSLNRTALLFLKSMVGSYILYTPHMSQVGGAAFSIVALLIIAFFTAVNMLKLLQCAKATGLHSYGDIGRAAFGRYKSTYKYAPQIRTSDTYFKDYSK
jgi:Transmembrane amino acid transporter protein